MIILDVVTKDDYQQFTNFEPHAVEIISRKSHITENCNQIWLAIYNVDYVILNVDYINEPMVFNSCDWNRNIHDWKSGAYSAYRLYAKRRSRYMTYRITTYQYVHIEVKENCEENITIMF